MKKISRFTGFSNETFSFLKALQTNNNKDWFEAHREVYVRFLVDPLRCLVNDLGHFMLIIDPHFDVTPAINRTISRIYRDTRFSKNKSPYKTTAWITFKRPGKDWRNSPAYFFELSADSYRFGMGFYGASPNTMSSVRQRIDKKPEEFEKVIALYKKQDVFHIEGEKYVRIINKEKSEEIQDWYQRRNLYFVCTKRINRILFSERLVENLSSSFFLLAPLYQYLLKVKENDAIVT
ncbi:MAG: DUF2461 domain-containing protein [Calditrichaeota bacterium]|nr:DUF2461 domain-containing protein [Calditrichota bacterium]